MDIRIKHLKYKGHPIATVGIMKKDEFYYGTVAVCNRQDQFAYKIGRNIVTGRLKKNTKTVFSKDLQNLIDHLSYDVIELHFSGNTNYLNGLKDQLTQLKQSFVTPVVVNPVDTRKVSPVTPPLTRKKKSEFLMKLRGH